MAQTRTSDSTMAQSEEQPEPHPQVEATELLDEQLTAVAGGARTCPIQPCI